MRAINILRYANGPCVVSATMSIATERLHTVNVFCPAFIRHHWCSHIGIHIHPIHELFHTLEDSIDSLILHLALLSSRQSSFLRVPSRVALDAARYVKVDECRIDLLREGGFVSHALANSLYEIGRLGKDKTVKCGASVMADGGDDIAQLLEEPQFVVSKYTIGICGGGDGVTSEKEF